MGYFTARGTNVSQPEGNRAPNDDRPVSKQIAIPLARTIKVPVAP